MRRRGIALISAVIMMSLLLVLLGAFLQINRSHLWLLNSSEARVRAQAACQAGHEYVLYRLEHDRHWSETAFDGRTEGQGSDLEVEEVAGQRTIRGNLHQMNASFEVDLENNLWRDTTSEFGVPPHCCRLTIRGYASGATRQVLTMLHVAPLFDSSALTRGRMVLNTDQFNIRSRDKWRNQIRAEQQIDIPNALTARTQFLMPDSSAQDGKGMMWSKSDIVSGGVKLNETNLADANLNSGGRFVPKARQHFEIFDLSADSIVTPQTNNTAMKPGVYRFTKANAQITVMATYGEGWGAEDQTINRNKEIEVLEYYANPEDTVPTKVYRSESKIEDLDIPQSTGGWSPKGLKSAEISTVKLNYGDVPVTLGDRVALDEAGKVMADLFTQEVKITPGTSVEVDGSLSIESNRGKPPRLDLGADSERAAIIAKGSLNLSNAQTAGVGTLISKEGDVSIMPLGENFEVETNNPLFGGLVLFAGRDVILKNPATDAGGKWDFKGLVYARNNFSFDAQGAHATVEGTIVARNGNMVFNSEGANVDFIYNPDYLKKMLQALPERRVQLERLYWRE